MADCILSLDVEAPMHRLPWWLKDAGEVNWPVHDPPAVWKSWGLRRGGLPVLEVLRGAPIPTPDASTEGLPTLHMVRTTEKGREQ